MIYILTYYVVRSRILMFVLTIIDGNAKASFSRLDIEFQYQREKVQHRKKSLAKKNQNEFVHKVTVLRACVKIFFIP